MTTSWAGPLLGAGGPGPGGLAGVETLGRQSWRGLVAQDRVPPSADGGKREVFILPLRAQDHFILYCEGELGGRQIRVARLLGEGPASQPRKAPPAPFPCAFCSGEAPEEAAGPTLRLGVRGGRCGRRMPASVLGRAWPLTRQLPVASPLAPLLGGAFGGRARVGRKFQLLGLHYGDEAQAGIGASGPSCPWAGGPTGHGGSLWPGAEWASAQGLAWTPSWADLPSSGRLPRAIPTPLRPAAWVPHAPETPGRTCFSSLALRPAQGLWVQPSGQGGRSLSGPRQPLAPQARTEVATLGCTLHPPVHLLVSPTGRNPENSPEAWEEFTEFAKAKKLNLKIFRPLQSGEKPTGAGCWLVPAAGPSSLGSSLCPRWGHVTFWLTEEPWAKGFPGVF